MMIRAIASLLLAALVPMTPSVAGQTATAVAAGGDAVPYRVLRGALTRADHEHYREVPFDLPAGVTRLTIRFSYGGREQHSVIDLGLIDPQRFRGWSGGARDHMTLSTEEATPGYLPGPLPAGRWRLLLGAPNIRVGASAPFEARIFIERGPTITEFADAPLSSRPGWYRGDLHMHSGNSDGTCLSQSGRKIPCPVYRTVEAAAARGLDFIAVTDHNTTAQFTALRALQPAFDKLLLVPGREITTFFGHSNVFGPTAFLDFRTLAPTYAAARRWIDTANAAGAIVSLNHSGSPSGEMCMGCGWRIADLPPGSVAAVEAVNGGTLSESGSVDGPIQGFALWQKLLDRGDHVTAIGGSDSHDPDRPPNRPGAVGVPTTVIHMQELSVHGLLDGIRAGRVFIDVDGTRDRVLDLSGASGGQRAAMGATLHVAKGAAARFDVMLAGVDEGSVDLLIDGKPWRTLPVGSGALSTVWTGDGHRHTVRALCRDAAGRPILIGNAIYIEN